MGRQRGRQAKYHTLLDQFNDDQVYTASMIADVMVDGCRRQSKGWATGPNRYESFLTKQLFFPGGRWN